MDHPIITSLMIVVAVVCAMLVFQAVYPSVVRGSDSVVSMERQLSERLKTEIAIIHAASELDSDGNWQDVNLDGDFSSFIWVKNLGEITLSSVESCDVFYGPEGNWARVPFEDKAEGAYPYWTWELENAETWQPTATLKITIHDLSVPESGRYLAKITTQNGISDELLFGM